MPLQPFGRALRTALERRGIGVLGEAVLDDFMTRRRIRYTGGITVEDGQPLRSETGAVAALVTTVEDYEASDPPRITVVARLVSTGDQAEILWMDGVALAGHEHPGFLGMGVVHDCRILEDRAVSVLADTLADHLLWPRAGAPRRDRGAEVSRPGRFRPRTRFAAPEYTAEEGRPVRIAVLPFANDSTRRNAGDILSLHFVRWLAATENVDIIEPGMVRKALLEGRLIMTGGISIPQIELVRALLDADLVVTGTVSDYQESLGADGVPSVVFTVRGIDARAERVVWTSLSYNRGDQGVFFFESGRVDTAYRLASEMVRQAVRSVAPRGRSRSTRRGLRGGE